MAGKRLLCLLLVLLLPAGCSWFAGPASGTSSLDSLGLEIWVSKDQVSSGDVVDVRFTVINRGTRTGLIELKDQPVMDIQIGIDTPWINSYPTVRWSDGREITPEMRRLDLAPGESKTIEMTWIALEDEVNYSARVRGDLRTGTEYGGQTASVYICSGACGGGY